jgi:hypothetical protein
MAAEWKKGEGCPILKDMDRIMFGSVANLLHQPAIGYPPGIPDTGGEHDGQFQGGPQFGGLLGLQRQLDGAAAGSVGNIQALIGRALEKHGSLDAIACHLFAKDMTSYKLKRRG